MRLSRRLCALRAVHEESRVRIGDNRYRDLHRPHGYDRSALQDIAGKKVSRQIHHSGPGSRCRYEHDGLQIQSCVVTDSSREVLTHYYSPTSSREGQTRAINVGRCTAAVCPDCNHWQSKSSLRQQPKKASEYRIIQNGIAEFNQSQISSLSSSWCHPWPKQTRVDWP